MSFIYSLSAAWTSLTTAYNGILMDVSNGAGGAPVNASASRIIKLTNNGTKVLDCDVDGNATVNTLGLAPLTFATLPSSPATGQTAYITDGVAPNVGATVTVGGGTYKTMLLYNGTNWIVVATVAFFNPGLITYNLIGVDASIANNDNIIPIVLPKGYTRFKQSSAVLSHANGDMTGGTFGCFSGASAGGLAFVATGTAYTISTASENTNLNIQSPAIVQGATQSYLLANTPNMYLRTQTAVSRTFDFSLNITALP